MLHVVEQTAFSGVDAPGDNEAGHVEDQEGPERSFRSAGHADRGAVTLRDEESTESSNGRGEAGDGRRFLVCFVTALFRVALGISLSISFDMIAGIIWKVEALPMPVAKNSRMKEAKKPQNAFG